MPTAVDEGIEADGGFDELAFQLLVRAFIAVGLAVIGAVLVWAGLARPSTPGSAFTGAPNGHSMPSRSPSPSQPTPERSPGRADKTDLRDQIKGLVLPESEPVSVSIPRIGVRSKLVRLGLKRGVMETPRPADVGWYSRGSSPGHSVRRSSPGTSLGTALRSSTA